MTEKPSRAQSTEARLLEMYSTPDPNPQFAAHLRAELLKRHRPSSHRAGLSRFWYALHTAGRWGLSLAGAALLIALIAAGALLLPGRLAGPGTVGTDPELPLLAASSTPNPRPSTTPNTTALAATAGPATAKSATAESAAGTATPAAILKDEVPSLSPRACQTLTTPTPSNGAYNRPGKLIGGGMVTSGDYQINLYLFCDDAYGPDTTDGSRYSDIQRLALYTSNWYSGQDMEGTTTEIAGIEPYLQERGGTGIQRGAGSMWKEGLRVNPGQVLDWSGAEFHLRYVYKIHHPAGQVYGAALTFRLVRAADGFVVRDAVVEALSAEERAKPVTFSTAKPPVPTRAGVTATATPVIPTPDVRALYPLTLAEAEEQAGFALLLPVSLPPRLSFTGAKYDAEIGMVEILYHLPGMEGLLVREQLVPAGAGCDLCGFILGNGKQVEKYPLGKLVSEDAKVETVQIGSSTGQYVEGVWTSWLECCGWQWDPITYRKRLRFRRGELAVEVWADSNTLTKADVIAFAEQLK